MCVLQCILPNPVHVKLYAQHKLIFMTLKKFGPVPCVCLCMCELHTKNSDCSYKIIVNKTIKSHASAAVQYTELNLSAKLAHTLLC